MDAINDPVQWNTELASLHHQQQYLAGLLSKTATTLNTLREKQSRNERALSNTPCPRSKKKKILQNRWRTDKTIKTCEKEEKAIFDTLQVCQRNIHYMELLGRPADSSSTAAGCSTRSSDSYDTPITTELDWNGWDDDQDISPFHKESRTLGILDEIPPEMTLRGADVPYTSRPLVAPPRISTVLPPVPPNTALPPVNSASLSPEAACFEPAVVKYVGEELDRLTISGYLASKCMKWIPKRRFSNAAVKHIFRCLSSSNLEKELPELASSKSEHGEGKLAVDAHVTTTKRNQSF